MGPLIHKAFPQNAWTYSTDGLAKLDSNGFHWALSLVYLSRTKNGCGRSTQQAELKAILSNTGEYSL